MRRRAKGGELKSSFWSQAAYLKIRDIECTITDGWDEESVKIGAGRNDSFTRAILVRRQAGS